MNSLATVTLLCWKARRVYHLSQADSCPSIRASRSLSCHRHAQPTQSQLQGPTGRLDAPMLLSFFPQAEQQLCVIHQIRNSIKYVASKEQKVFMADLKKVYKATNESRGRASP